MITKLLRCSGLVVVLFLLFLNTCIAAESKQNKVLTSESKSSEQMGRFQVLPVEYEVEYASGKSIKKAFLKVDTLTGRSWIYSESYTKQDDGGFVVGIGWSELEDFKLSHMSKSGKITPLERQ